MHPLGRSDLQGEWFIHYTTAAPEFRNNQYLEHFHLCTKGKHICIFIIISHIYQRSFFATSFIFRENEELIEWYGLSSLISIFFKHQNLVNPVSSKFSVALYGLNGKCLLKVKSSQLFLYTSDS